VKANLKGAKRASRGKGKARPQPSRDPSERDAKDFIVAAIEASLTQTLEQLGFTNREVKDLLAGSTKALTEAVREKLSRRGVKK
jgi:hypothetical protein